MEVQPTHCSLVGGWWERLIQMVKKLLRRVLGRAFLSYEETMSIICDCEATVNSRPLTYIFEDTQDLLPLTPAMYLQDVPQVGVTDLDHLDKTEKKVEISTALEREPEKTIQIGVPKPVGSTTNKRGKASGCSSGRCCTD